MNLLLLSAFCAIAAASSNQFAFNVFKHLVAKNENKAVLFSPVSLGVALSLIHEGASGDTQNELTQLLEDKGSNVAAVSEHYSAVVAGLKNVENATLSMATRFFVRKSFGLNQEYNQAVTKQFGAAVEGLDFSKSAESADAINAFVKKETGGKIDKLVDKGSINGNTFAFLINAIYFKANWATKFESEPDRVFHAHAGDKKIPFMQKKKLKVRHHVDDDYNTELIAIPYENSDLSFFAVLPKDGFSPSTLSLESLNKLDDTVESKLEVHIPKFRAETEIDCVPVLKALGVQKIFKGGDLSKIAPGGLEVSEVRQKAFIEVNEAGAEAAAATSVGMTFKSASMSLTPPVIFDRPFVYGIRKGKDILFMGAFMG